MNYIIIWSDFAASRLDEIFDYYVNKASPEVAKKLLIGIINEANKLIQSPYIGQVEERLKNRQLSYRYLLYKNYKLIYSVDEKNGFIKVADVFDSRQNPPKIKRRK